MSESKNVLALRDEAHRLGLAFYKALPDDVRACLHERVIQAYPNGVGERLLNEPEKHGELQGRILRHLIDFVSLEQALILYRCEMCAYFRRIGVSAARGSKIYKQYIDLEKEFWAFIKKGFHSEWYDSKSYSQDDLDYMFKMESYLVWLNITKEMAGVLIDVPFLERCKRVLSSSAPNFYYTTHYLETLVLFDKGSNTAQDKEQEDSIYAPPNIIKNKTHFDRLQLKSLAAKTPTVRWREEHYFTPFLLTHIAEESTRIEHQWKVRFMDAELCRKGFYKTLRMFKRHKRRLSMSNIAAEFDMAGGNVSIDFSVRNALLKDMGGALLLLDFGWMLAAIFGGVSYNVFAMIAVFLIASCLGAIGIDTDVPN